MGHTNHICHVTSCISNRQDADAGPEPDADAGPEPGLSPSLSRTGAGQPEPTGRSRLA